MCLICYRNVPSRPAKIPQVPDHRPDQPVILRVRNMRRSVTVIHEGHGFIISFTRVGIWLRAEENVEY